MSDLVPFVPSDDRSHGQQLRDALEKALAIQGTVINDLESAINCIMQMERALQMVGAANPHDATARYLKAKYKMNRQTSDESESNSRKLLEGIKEVLTDGDVLALTEGKVDSLRMRLWSEDEIVDAEVIDG